MTDVDTLLKRPVKPLPKHRLARPCEIARYNNNKIWNDRIDHLYAIPVNH